MVTKAAVEEFLSQKKIAVVGVSRHATKFGNTIYKELKSKGYQLYPINAHTEKINNEICYLDLKSLPENVDGIVTVVPPAETEKMMREAASLGIKHVWMQQGSESDTAIRFCEENNMKVVYGECILMFAEPVSFLHRAHRWFWGLIEIAPN